MQKAKDVLFVSAVVYYIMTLGSTHACSCVILGEGKCHNCMLLQAVAPQAAVGLVGTVALAGFAVGWVWETLADYQKSVFKSKPENKHR